MKKEVDKINNWQIELTEEQLILISNALEFVSRFACGQIGFTYLPYNIQELFYNKDEEGNLNWDEINKRRNLFDATSGILKTALYPELNPTTGESYGINKTEYADNLYDIYKMMNHKMHENMNINSSPQDISTNVNSYFSKFGNLSNIKLKKFTDERN